MLTQTRDLFRKYTNDETFDRIKEYSNVSEMWKDCVNNYSSDIAIVDNGESYSYARLESDCAKMRTIIKDANSKEKMNVGILCANSYDFVKAYLAVVTSGHTAVILPAQLDNTAVFGCSMKYSLDMLIYQPQLEEKISLVSEKLKNINLVNIESTCDEETPITICEPSTPCVIIFTGGTTGKSKGALLSHQAVMQGTVNGCYGYKDVFGQRYMLVLPLSHVFGLIRNLMTSLYTGSTLFVCRNNKDMFHDIAVFKPNILVLVPALAEMALTLSKKFGRNMLGEDMKYIICGAAAVSPYLVEEYANMGISLFPGYGLTESANLVSGNPESTAKPSSVGIPYPNQELKLVDGELWLKGKNMLDCYIGEDAENSFSDGWFRTGDLVRIDDDGYLYITGRTKEVIILSNGENISPAEVEAKFNELDFVQDSQVFEDIDESGKHILALEVVLRQTELAKYNTEDINSFAKQELEKVNLKLPTYQRVNKMTIRETDFERTPSMKILRYKKFG
ncbi:MAG: class I adenylate-forming enzyme family protein [Clostridia bacterium]|nr:class I adenylate-forming enzyme family protein [Clostridia bacterium]